MESMKWIEDESVDFDLTKYRGVNAPPVPSELQAAWNKCHGKTEEAALELEKENTEEK